MAHDPDEPDGGQSATSDPEDEEAHTANRIVSIYYTYVGTPDDTRDIYVGFGLFFAGVVLGVVALGVFLYSKAQTPGNGLYWPLREVAIVAAVLGLPAVFGSVVVLLPVGHRTQLVGAAGAVLCLLAAGLVVTFYPHRWIASGIDGSIMTISVYATGLVLLSAATGTALVAEYLDKATAARATSETPPATDATTTTEQPTEPSADDATVTNEQVERDIEASLDDVELSWGGVEQTPTTKRLDLNMPDSELDDDQVEGADETGATTDRTDGDAVDDAVAGLQRLQGTGPETARTSDVEDEVTALTEFRAEQSDGDEVETGVDESRGILDKTQTWLSDRL